MNYSEQLKEYFDRVYPAPLTIEQIKEYLSPVTADEITQMHLAVNAMLDEGDLMLSKKGKYALPKSMGFFKGKIRGSMKQFGFLLCEDREDIFIPPKYMHDAFDGDTAYVKLLPRSYGQRDEGEVVKVLRRGRKEIVGTYYSSGNFGFVSPDDKRFSKDIYIGKRHKLTAKSGDKVVAQITLFSGGRDNPEGKITEVLGSMTDAGIDILSVIKSHNLRVDFPAEVLSEVALVPAEVEERELKGRRNFTKDLVITIDGEDARDLDDAVSVTKDGHGNFILSVHIADVSRYVTSKTAINEEALTRGTSVYFPDRVLPMLPRELSNGICSLNENVTRLTLSVIMTIDRSGTVTGHELTRGFIRTKHRMTYTAVTKLLGGDEAERMRYADVLPMIEDMGELAKILSDKRTARGSIDFDMPECKIVLNEQGKVTDVLPYERTLAHRIIEEFMILANETVAEFMCRMELPFIYRVHEKPSEEKMLGFKKLLAALGLSIKTKGEIHSRMLLSILDEVRDKPVFPVVNRVMLRSMQKAKYTPENVGHFGLSSKFYCHFTSPIRRYPDLMIHRIIGCMLDGKLDEKQISKFASKIYEISERSSEREREADEAEREADNLKKAEFMADKIGNIYDGVVSGVTDFCIFVELKNTVEGQIKIDKLPKDVYNYMENTYSLVGANHAYRLGDSVTVSVESVNRDTAKVEFVIYENHSAE